MSTFHGLLLLLLLSQAFRLHRNRGILPPLFHYPPPLIFESHRIYRRRNFIINHFSLVQASNTEFSQPGNRDENRFNFWKNANTRISPFIFILFLAFLLRNRISKPPPSFFVITRVRGFVSFRQSERSIRWD